MNRDLLRHEITEEHDRPAKFSEKFFDLQLEFAKHMQNITSEDWEECLFKYTNFYNRFRLSKPKDNNNEKWKEIVGDLTKSENPAGLARQLYEEAEHNVMVPPEFIGNCFRYEYKPNTKIVFIHFDSNDPQGPLSEERIGARYNELKEIFESIKEQYPEAERVNGSSWLYNLSAYKRLFPKEYTASPSLVDKGLSGLGVWGQFLDKDGNVKEQLAQKLMESMKNAEVEEDVLESFPFRKLNVGCDIKYFYLYFNIET